MEYLPPFYFHPIRPRFKRSNLRVDESQCLKILIFKKNCVSANSRRSETGCNVECQQLYLAKITLYTVVLKRFRGRWLFFKLCM